MLFLFIFLFFFHINNGDSMSYIDYNVGEDKYVSNLYDESYFYAQKINTPSNLGYFGCFYIGVLFIFIGFVFVFCGKFLRQ